MGTVLPSSALIAVTVDGSDDQPGAVVVRDGEHGVVGVDETAGMVGDGPERVVEGMSFEQRDRHPVHRVQERLFMFDHDLGFRAGRLRRAPSR